MVRSADAPPWRRAAAWVVVLAVLPWLWFAVRDAFGVVTDVVAIGLPVLAGAVVVASVLVAARKRVALVLAVSTLLAAAVAVLAPWIPSDLGAVDGRGVTVASANVDDRRASTAELRALGSDVLVVVEVPDRLGDRLADAYPHRVETGPGLPGSPS